MLDAFALLHKPVYHMIGNHCLYNLPRGRLNEALGIHGVTSYYSFSPHKAWRFVVIDAYDVSMLGWPEGHPLYQQAKTILDEKNINEVSALHVTVPPLAARQLCSLHSSMHVLCVDCV